MFWAPNGLDELPEVSFEFLFIGIGKSAMAFLPGRPAPIPNKAWGGDITMPLSLETIGIAGYRDQ